MSTARKFRRKNVASTIERAMLDDRNARRAVGIRFAVTLLAIGTTFGASIAGVIAWLLARR